MGKDDLSLGDLILLAKGDDRSLRDYATDSGVDVSVLSKMIKGTYTPKKEGIYQKLTSYEANPRNGITFLDLYQAASKNVITAYMTAATVVTGGLLSPLMVTSLAKANSKNKGSSKFRTLARKIVVDGLVKNGYILEGNTGTEGSISIIEPQSRFYLVYDFILSSEEARNGNLIRERFRLLMETLIYKKPIEMLTVCFVTNNPKIYKEMLSYKDNIAYKGDLVILFIDEEDYEIHQEDYLCFYDDKKEEEAVYILSHSRNK